MEAARLFVSVGAETDQAERGLTSVSRSLDGFAVAAGTLVADAVRSMTGALAGLGRQGLAVAIDYESSLNTFGAVSGATADQLGQVAARAKELGADLSLPGTSAGDAAAAMTELAKAGMSVEQSMTAAKGVLQLSAAAQVDNATAAQITANALNAFGLGGDQAVRVADLLAGAANASSASMTDLAQGLQQGAFAFDAGGQSIDDLVASLAILTNVGLTGSDSATALKNAMLRLQAPTDQAAKLMAELGISAFDANGNMLPFEQILGSLQAGLGGLTQEQRNAALNTIFLSDGMKAIIPLLDVGTAGFAAMRAEVSQQGSAAEVSAAQMAGLGGAVEGFKSQVETFLLTVVEPMLPALAGVVNAGSSVVSSLTALAQAAIASGDPLGFVATQLRQLAEQGLQQIQAQIPTVLAGLEAFGTNVVARLQAAAPGILAALQGWGEALVGWVGDRIPVVLATLQRLGTDTAGRIQAAAPGILDALATWGEALVGWLLERGPGLLLQLGRLRNRVVFWALDTLPDLIDALGTWGLALLDWLVRAAPDLLRGFGRVTGELLDGIGQRLPAIVDRLARWGAALVDWVIVAGPPLLRELGRMGVELLGWVAARVPGIAEQLGVWAVQFFTWVGPAATRLIFAAGGLLGELLTWIVGQSPAIGAKLAEWGSAFGAWVYTRGVPALLGAVGFIGVSILGWIQEQAGRISQDGSIGQAIIDGILSSLQPGWNAVKEAGRGLIEGFWRGIQERWRGLLNTMSTLVAQLPEALRNLLGIHSPSRVAMEIGAFFSEGLAIGVTSETGTIAAAGRTAGAALVAPVAALPIPAAATAAAAPGAGGGLTVIVNVQGSVMAERDLAMTVRDQLLEYQRYNGTTGIR
jgi:TP901 family phage tail tape measure protein